RLVNATVFLRHDDTHILCRRDIPGRFQVRNGLIREVIKRHKLRPCEQLGETPAHACLPCYGGSKKPAMRQDPLPQAPCTHRGLRPCAHSDVRSPDSSQPVWASSSASGKGRKDRDPRYFARLEASLFPPKPH